MRDLHFTRLFTLIDELCEEGVLDGEGILAQMGAEPYQPQYFKHFEMIEDKAFKEQIKASDFIISHAGTGTVTTCLKMGKKVILFPRLVKFNEHYDDHQLELSEVFTQKGYTLSANNKEELKQCILNINQFIPEPFVSHKREMNQLLHTYIKNWFPI